MAFPCPYKRILCCLVNLIAYQLSLANPGQLIAPATQDDNISEELGSTTAEYYAPLDNDAAVEETSLNPAAEEMVVVVRCYCNLPECVAIGYMCKSSLGACFTRHLGLPQAFPAVRGRQTGRGIKGSSHVPIRGCVEFLSREGQEVCLQRRESRNVWSEPEEDKTRNIPGPGSSTAPPTSVRDSRKGLLTCCSEDVCNFDDHLFPASIDSNNPDIPCNKKEPSDSYTLSLFNAATIAVPIAGVFILIILVFMASRILKSTASKANQESKNHPLKVPFLSGDNFRASTDSAGPILCAESLLHKSCKGRPVSLYHNHRYPTPACQSVAAPKLLSSLQKDISPTPFTSYSTVYSKDSSTATLEELEPLNSSARDDPTSNDLPSPS